MTISNISFTKVSDKNQSLIPLLMTNSEIRTIAKQKGKTDDELVMVDTDIDSQCTIITFKNGDWMKVEYQFDFIGE